MVSRTGIGTEGGSFPVAALRLLHRAQALADALDRAIQGHGTEASLRSLLEVAAALLELAADGTPVRTVLASCLAALPASSLDQGAVKGIVKRLDCCRGVGWLSLTCGEAAKLLRQIARTVPDPVNRQTRRPPGDLDFYIRLLAMQQARLFRLFETTDGVSESAAIKALWPDEKSPAAVLRARLRQLERATRTSLMKLLCPYTIRRDGQGYLCLELTPV